MAINNESNNNPVIDALLAIKNRDGLDNFVDEFIKYSISKDGHLYHSNTYVYWNVLSKSFTLHRKLNETIWVSTLSTFRFRKESWITAIEEHKTNPILLKKELGDYLFQKMNKYKADLTLLHSKDGFNHVDISFRNELPALFFGELFVENIPMDKLVELVENKIKKHTSYQNCEIFETKEFKSVFNKVHDDLIDHFKKNGTYRDKVSQYLYDWARELIVDNFGVDELVKSDIENYFNNKTYMTSYHKFLGFQSYIIYIQDLIQDVYVSNNPNILKFVKNLIFGDQDTFIKYKNFFWTHFPKVFDNFVYVCTPNLTGEKQIFLDELIDEHIPTTVFYTGYDVNLAGLNQFPLLDNRILTHGLFMKFVEKMSNMNFYVSDIVFDMIHFYHKKFPHLFLTDKWNTIMNNISDNQLIIGDYQQFNKQLALNCFVWDKSFFDEFIAK